jgi:hypothetical protein
MAAADNKARITAFFASLTGTITNDVPALVAETATEYFKENILKGVDVDGIEFKELSPEYLAQKKINKDKVMYYRGLLFASVRPSDVTASRVVISAGSQQVPYARIHNEGLTVNTTAHVRAFTRNSYKYSKKGKRGKSIGTQQVKAHDRKMNYTMPRRQFMGYSAELNTRLMTRIKALMNSKS